MKKIILLSNLFVITIMHGMKENNLPKTLDDVPQWMVTTLNELNEQKPQYYRGMPYKEPKKILALTSWHEAKIIEILQSNCSSSFLGPFVHAFGSGDNIYYKRKYFIKTVHAGYGIFLETVQEVTSFDDKRETFQTLITNLTKNWKILPTSEPWTKDYITLMRETQFYKEKELIYQLSRLFDFSDIAMNINQGKTFYPPNQSRILVHKEVLERFAEIFKFSCFTKAQRIHLILCFKKFTKFGNVERQEINNIPIDIITEIVLTKYPLEKLNQSHETIIIVQK